MTNSKIIHNQLVFHTGPVVSLHSVWHINYFLIALGGQDGEVTLLKYALEPFAVHSSSRVWLDGPISAVLLFEIETEVIDLLVVSAAGYCILYRDVVQELLTRKIIIKPPCYDALTAVSASDVDFDGQKEILVGSFSKEIFCFKITENSANLMWKIEAMHPIQCISDIDINKDGVNEIIVVTMYGITILTPNFYIACNKLRAVTKYLNICD